MPSANRRYSKDEFARRGDQIYQSVVRPRLTAKDENRFVAIDIDSGEYEIDTDELSASDRLRARLPEAQIWLTRAAAGYLHRFGGRGLRRDL